MIKVTKGKNRQLKMEAMLRLLAETSAPIEDAEKDELLHHMSGMYKVCTRKKEFWWTNAVVSFLLNLLRANGMHSSPQCIEGV